METTNKFKYKIRSFDKQSLKLTVDFDDGRWAQITLVAPLPTTKAGLEKIISQYVEPMEYKTALTDNTVDWTYLDNLVGVEQEASRMWLTPPPSPAPKPIDPETGKLVEELIAEIIGEEASENQVNLYGALSKLKDEYSKICYLMQPDMMASLTDISVMTIKQWSSEAIQRMKEYQQAITQDIDFNPPPISVDIIVEFKLPGGQ